MRKLFYTAAAAAALALSSTAANAALVLSPTPAPGPAITVPASGTFGNSVGNSTTPATLGLFTDVYNFTLDLGSLGNASLISLSLEGGNNIDFTCPGCSVLFDGTPFTPGSAGALDTFILSPTVLASGPHAISITGDIVSGETASYSGTFNFNRVSVPEPATWGLMLLGFLGIGMAVRRSRRPALAQLA